jgi:NADPH-dependent curcumin reductase
MLNQQMCLATRPEGLPKATDWLHKSEQITALSENDVLVKVHLISLDPAMRGWMNVSRSYIRPVEIGEVMRAGGAGIVVESKNPSFKIGDAVVGNFGVQTYYTAREGKHLTKIDTQLVGMSTWLGILGLTGMTAYFGLLDIGQPQAGETVVASAGAGAVGAVVGQIAKIKGCRVIGIAGGAEKCAFMSEKLNFDATIDYKQGNLRSALRRAAPEGIDVYFDNVGGEILDTCLTMLKPKARIVVCGAISQYNNTEAMRGPANYLSLLVNRAKMEGFVVFDYAPRYGEAIKDLITWLKTGEMYAPEHIVNGGIDDFPTHLNTLFVGDKIGKMMLKIVD